MSVSINWIDGTMENMIQHFHVDKPPYLGNQYPICPSWREIWPVQHNGVGPSGA